MRRIKPARALCCLVFVVAGLLQPREARAAYDFDNGNALFDIIGPALVPVILTEVSPSGSDASLVLRVTALFANTWFDATAPYHPTAVGVYTRLGRRPASESATNRNINIALLYSSYRMALSVLPRQRQLWRDMLTGVGLDPDDNSTNLASPVGIGNVAGAGVVNGRLNDGMNQLGTEGARTFNPLPYADYTGYRPLNSAYQLFDPSHWQPDMQRLGTGLYKIQQFVTPQYALMEPYTSVPRRRAPAPRASDVRNFSSYKAQADEVLRASADLNDQRKLTAELFNNKLDSLGASVGFVAFSRGYSMLQFIQLDLVTQMAALDAGIYTWREKRRYDAVRPFSAIRHIYGDRNVTAWGGPGRGTVSLPANQWQSYLPVADHPEYPSGSACFCAAHAQAARRYTGTDALGFAVFKPAGSSGIEPGVTPAVDTVLTFNTWTDFARECGESRLWGGVHFRPAIEEGGRTCGVFGDQAANYVQSLIDGSAPPRGPSTASAMSSLE